MRFAVVVNINREEALALSKDLIAWFEERKLDYVLDANSAAIIGTDKAAEIENLNKLCDVFISLGGDGTLLFASRYSETKPVIGINVGHLGFLAEFSREEMIHAIEKVLEGTYSIHDRSQLDVMVPWGKDKFRHYNGLNDVVLEKGTHSRIPAFIIRLDGEQSSAYRADGIIIATSTGSTGYSLSAGGPVIAPKSKVFVITPICPHMLTVRPLVISDEKTIEISVDAPGGEYPLNCDGHLIKMLKPGEMVTVKKSLEMVNLVANEKRNYWDILRNKLFWGREHKRGT